MSAAEHRAIADPAAPADPTIAPQIADLVGLRAAVLATRPRGTPSVRAAARPGSHVGARRGHGMDFAELRPYQPGDDIRQVDWRQMARHARVYTKVFREERERPVHLMVDLGPSMQFGTRTAFKSVAAARAAALLAWQAVEAGDRVAGLVWHGTQFMETAARARRAGALGLIELLCATPAPSEGQAATFTAVLDRLARRSATGDSVVILSDFLALDAAGAALLARIAHRTGCTLALVHDRFESHAPPPGRYALFDGQRDAIIDFSDPRIRQAHEDAFAARQARLAALCAESGARLMLLATDTSPQDILGDGRG